MSGLTKNALFVFRYGRGMTGHPWHRLLRRAAEREWIGQYESYAPFD